jgi:hypothetical protein
VTSQINVQFTSFVYNMSRSKVTRLYSPKNIWYVICDKKNFPWFVIWYDFYPTRCVFSIPSPRLGDRKHKTRWLKIISNHKPWEILYLLLKIKWPVLLCYLKGNKNCLLKEIQYIWFYWCSLKKRRKERNLAKDWNQLRPNLCLSNNSDQMLCLADHIVKNLLYW